MTKRIYYPIAFPGGTGFQEVSADGSRVTRLADGDGQDMPTPAEYNITSATPVDVPLAVDDEPEVQPEPDPVPVPDVVTMAQARVALRHAGLLDKVTASLKALPAAQRDDALIAWEYAPNVARTGALVVSLAGAFGLSDADLDSLFRAAAQVQL